MGFLYRLQENIRRFMYGRNGMDTFGLVLLAAYCVLSLGVNIFEGKIALVFYFCALAVFVYFVYRALSRNIYKRQEENRKVQRILSNIKNFFKRNRYNSVESNKVIKKCPCCKAKIRLPKVKGKHSVTCPKCRETFNVKI